MVESMGLLAIDRILVVDKDCVFDQVILEKNR